MSDRAAKISATIRATQQEDYALKVPALIAQRDFPTLRRMLKGIHLQDDLRQDILACLTEHDESPVPRGEKRTDKVRHKISIARKNHKASPDALKTMRSAQRDRRRKEHHAHVTNLIAGGDGPKYLRKSLIKQGLIPDTEDRI
jgi:hypothetical protein